MENTNFKRKLSQLKKINVALIGHMGSGKSIIGKEISRKLNLKHFDSDDEISKFENKTILQIFETNNEEYFRKIEAQILIKLLNKMNSIISLGGGSILNSIIREKLKITRIKR